MAYSLFERPKEEDVEDLTLIEGREDEWGWDDDEDEDSGPPTLPEFPEEEMSTRGFLRGLASLGMVLVWLGLAGASGASESGWKMRYTHTPGNQDGVTAIFPNEDQCQQFSNQVRATGGTILQKCHQIWFI